VIEAVGDALASIPMEWYAYAATAALSFLVGNERGKRAVKTVVAGRSLYDTVCDAIEDGTVTPEEAGKISAAAQNVIAAATSTE